MTADQLLKLICLLDAKPRTSEELAEALGVEKKAIQRAASKLRKLGIRVSGEAEAGHVRHLESDPQCPTCLRDLDTKTVRRVLR